jgi:hypothetical protein
MIFSNVEEGTGGYEAYGDCAHLIVFQGPSYSLRRQDDRRIAFVRGETMEKRKHCIKCKVKMKLSMC